jgi:outer membrane protein assembly factor BamB
MKNNKILLSNILNHSLSLSLLLGLSLGLSHCQNRPKWMHFPSFSTISQTQHHSSQTNWLVADPQAAQLSITTPPSASLFSLTPRYSDMDQRHMNGHLSLSLPLHSSPQSVITIPGNKDIIATPILPIITDNHIFGLGSDSTLYAYSVNNRTLLWKKNLHKHSDKKKQIVGGGIAYSDQQLAISYGLTDIVLVDVQKGDVIWRKSLSNAVRTAPTIIGSFILVNTIDNRLIALNRQNGKSIWEHQAATESLGIFGNSKPLVINDLVFVTFGSGELTALHLRTGRTLWSANLVDQRRIGTNQAFVDADATPIRIGELVVAAAHSGPLSAFDIRSGKKHWSLPINGIRHLWHANQTIFTISSQGELVAIDGLSGKIIWVTALSSLVTDSKAASLPHSWFGPILAGDALLVNHPSGHLLSLSPHNGKLLTHYDITKSVTNPVIPTPKGLWFLSDKGVLWNWSNNNQ